MKNNKKITILHVTEPFGGGTVNVLINLTKSLSGHNHIIFHGVERPDGSVEQVRSRFSTDVKFSSWKFAQREISLIYDFLSFLYLCKYILTTPHDILHLHASKAGFLGRILAWILRRKNVIYTSHGAAFVREDITLSQKKFYIKLEKLAASLTGTVVCCSDSELNAYQKYNIPAVCIYNGTQIKENRSKIRSILEDNQLVIITSGRITMPKNPSLFNTIAKYFLPYENIKFIWVGDGELRDLITSENIKVTGWKNADQVDEYLLSSDLYLSTSLWEGLPLAVLEAMNTSLPLLLSNCMGNRDLVMENENGFIFKEASEAIKKIVYLMENKSILREYGYTSRKICIEKFNIQKLSKDYEILYFSKL